MSDVIKAQDIDFSYRENEFYRRAALDDVVRMQKPALLTDEISVIKEYAGHLSVTQLVLDSYYWRVSDYRESNLALQTLIRKEYGI